MRIGKRNFILFGFVCLLVLSAGVRRCTFRLPHFRGDQLHYVSLAFKLDRQGTAGYNLRGVDMKDVSPWETVLVPAPGRGQVLKVADRLHSGYYDRALHHIPFGFPFALMTSHRIFSGSAPYSLLFVPDENDILRTAPPGRGLRDYRFPPGVGRKQFYAVIVPFVFSLLLVMSVFFLSRAMYRRDGAALAAMALMAIAPVDILTAQRIWADDMTAFFTVIAVLLFWLSVEKDRVLLAPAAGLACGLAAITKQSGAFVIPAIVLWFLLINRERLSTPARFIGTLLDRKLLYFGLGFILSAGYWFVLTQTVYGNPLYRPAVTQAPGFLRNTWFALVINRPWYFYIAGIPYQNPLFALAYLSPLGLFLDRKNFRPTLLLILWLLMFFLVFQVWLVNSGKEHRYMLPAYAAFAVLAGYLADRAGSWFDKKTGKPAGRLLLAAVLVLSAAWSIPIGLHAVFYDQSLITVPF